MTALELARLQFAVTTVFHFIFVPLSIGMAGFVATLQTMHYRTGNPVYGRMTRFWGKLMLLSFAVGVVTGIVQEFQFGMNWSEYSRYVGDVFGAPLAMEGLAAFFLESTFIGLWIFGRGRMSPRLHLATIWMVFVGTLLSAYFILAANSWMQHPVGYKIADSGRAEMTSIWAVLTNSTTLYAFPHTMLGAAGTAGMVVLGVSAWKLLRKDADRDGWMRSATLALGVTFVATIGTATVGHFQAQLMTEQQPMKMAAAEALYDTETGPGLSLFAVAPFEKSPERLTWNVTFPQGLSILSTNGINGRVEGINDLQREYEQTYGPGDYTPVVGLTYWTFRIMVGAGVAMIVITGIGLWLVRRKRLELSPRYLTVAAWAIPLPFVAHATGWIFTEMGRQPWVVHGLLLTQNANSPTVGAGTIVTSLLLFTVLYGTLAAVAGWIAVREIRKGTEPAPTGEGDEPSDLSMAY